MFLIPGITALFTFVYLRPHEAFEALRPVTTGWIVLFLLLTYVLDLRLGFSRPRLSPILGLFTVIVGLSLIGLAIKAPGALEERFTVLSVAIISFAFVSQGLQSLRAINAVAAVLLAITLALIGIGIQQGLSPKVCFLQNQQTEMQEARAMEGHPCTTVEQCVDGGPPGVEYWCEHPGLMGTRSIGGRVRFRGLLEDPNELAMTIAIGVPLAFAFYGLRRSKTRLGLLMVTLASGFVCVIMTKSRSGQLSMLAALGVYFIRRFGRGGLLAAGALGLPLILLGGRSGAEAESSSDERLDCWRAGFDMWRENPFLGVGQGQFAEHHYLTAHNSVMLTLAELGPLGLVTWTAALFVGFKIVIRASMDFEQRGEAAAVHTWATALLASLAGMAVSTFFLSVAYHPVIWILLALVTSYATAIRAHDPSWRVRFGWRDLVAVVWIDVAIVGLMALYLRAKGG